MNGCKSQGRPDMYGLGIRLGFYSQWFGEMFNEYVDQPDVADVRCLGVLLTSAVLLGLIVQSLGSHLDPADMYIVLLLTAGTYVFLIPMYVWRVLTCCDQAWDPLKWTRELKFPIYDMANFILLLCVASFGVWFYAIYLPKKEPDCQQYGFLFAKIRLKDKLFIGVNTVVYLIILLICAGIFLNRAGYWERFFGVQERRRPRISSKEQKDLLRLMRGLSNITVYGLHIASIELAIQWNQFTNVNAISTNDQILPLLVSAGIVLRAMITHYAMVAAEASAAGSEFIVPSDASIAARRGSPQPPWWMTMEEAAQQAARTWVPQPVAAYRRGRTRW
ncbi:hypothetical protein PT974_03256 [Cladobotryum mycophilum]|uniref:Uncharacterized protein n=1 Tax=Cladobotryum mycophilum TaxID=491253 RepID=A0ABR0SRS3_9HYPO